MPTPAGDDGNDTIPAPERGSCRKDQHKAGEDLIERVQWELGPELLDLLLRSSASVPQEWRRWPPQRGFQHLRERLRCSQAELARESGMDRAQISRFEGGADARLSTWQRLYAALGLELILIPACALSIDALEERLEARRPPGHWRLGAARPRRRWPDLRK